MTDGGNVTQLRSVLRSDLIQPIDPRIKLVRDWWGIEPEPIEDIVEGLVPKRLVTLFAGRAGNGKSFACQMMTTATALGCDWFGRKVKKCRSLLVSAEDPNDRLHERQHLICNHYGHDILDLDDRAVIMANDDGNFELYGFFRAFDPGKPRTLWLQLKKWSIDEGIELLILDNVQHIWSGDANNELHVKSFLRYFNSQAREMNAAIVMVANPPKSRDSYFSGNQKWEDSCRNTLSLSGTLDRDGKAVDGHFTLKVEKSNYLPYNHPLKRKGIPLEWVNDVLVAGEIPEPAPLDNPGLLDLEGRILKAVSHAVNVLGWKFAADPASTNYLPGKLARQKNWQHIAWVDLVATLDRLLTEGRLVKALVKDTWLLRLPDEAPYPGEVKQ
jgi:hypothetical protein